MQDIGGLIERGTRKAVHVVYKTAWVPVMRRQALANIRKFSPPYRLNLACGKVHYDGWINIDARAAAGTDVIWDLRFPLPIAASTCTRIYCEHFLEHLGADEGLAFLRECRRMLQPGGVVRIAMPSLDAIIEKAYNGTWQDMDWLSWPQFQFIKSRSQMINTTFYSWGHKWLYDRDELHRRLRDAGFEAIVDVAWRQSAFEDLSNLETRKDSMLICEATKQ